MKNRRNFTMSDFYCTNCSEYIVSLPRPIRKQREKGHLKEMWCPFCKAEHNCCEIKPFGSSYTYQNFKQEFELGRFKNGVKCKIGELQPCGEDCKYSVNGRCWNWNYSYNCDKRGE